MAPDTVRSNLMTGDKATRRKLAPLRGLDAATGNAARTAGMKMATARWDRSQQLDRLLGESRSRPLRRVETRTSQALWQLVERGVGVGVVAQFALSGRQVENVVVRPFRPTLSSEVLLLNARHRPLSRLAEAFCEHIHAFVKDMDEAIDPSVEAT